MRSWIYRTNRSCGKLSCSSQTGEDLLFLSYLLLYKKCNRVLWSLLVMIDSLTLTKLQGMSSLTERRSNTNIKECHWTIPIYSLSAEFVVICIECVKLQQVTLRAESGIICQFLKNGRENVNQHCSVVLQSIHTISNDILSLEWHHWLLASVLHSLYCFIWKQHWIPTSACFKKSAD